MTLDKITSVNYSRFCKLYGAVGVLANNEPLRRANRCLHLQRSNQSHLRSSQSLQQRQNMKSNMEKNGYQQSTKPAVSSNKSIKCKMLYYEHAHMDSIYTTCINSDNCPHKCRLSVRKLKKQHVKQSGDREPCRLPLKKIVVALRNKKIDNF